ncbi:uncharacterized protein PV09_07552 [Verruconis gallopava]|uniref:Uncharacterized protein n=1 Tax=Verruconis gallopava TaxID=253628 RepID=A0A0D1YJL7_9PEZI|nr:uncharacterized protein PV09_07552 [Verruconis gallopava]KIW01037.1 hypothetical protein PV09_07552 [Verruconis gallopava]
MEAFFRVVSPNPAANFAFANLLLLTVSTFVPEPNHLGRLLHPQRYFNGRDWHHLIYYFLWMPSACLASSIANALLRPADKRFWIEVLRHVNRPLGKSVSHSKKKHTNERLRAVLENMMQPTNVYCLLLQPTDRDNLVSITEHDDRKQTVKMIFLSEGQALFFFLLTTTLHESSLGLLFLLPLVAKVLAYLTAPCRHGQYHTESSTAEKEGLSTRRSTVPGLGVVIVRGQEFYVRQFGRIGTYGQVKYDSVTRSTATVARNAAHKSSVALLSLAQVLSVAGFMWLADWERGDLVPWLWFLQQTLAVFAWMSTRLSGLADKGRTEELLGKALSEHGHVILRDGKSHFGIQASLETQVVDGREQVEKVIKIFEQATELRNANPELSTTENETVRKNSASGPKTLESKTGKNEHATQNSSCSNLETGSPSHALEPMGTYVMQPDTDSLDKPSMTQETNKDDDNDETNIYEHSPQTPPSRLVKGDPEEPTKPLKTEPQTIESEKKENAPETPAKASGGVSEGDGTKENNSEDKSGEEEDEEEDEEDAQKTPTQPPAKQGVPILVLEDASPEATQVRAESGGEHIVDA